MIPVNLRALTQTLTKKEKLDERVEKALTHLAEDIVDDVVDFACRLAKHRGSNSLNRNDIRLAFEKRLKVRVPIKSQMGLQAGGGQLATASANLPVVLPPQSIATTKYESNLALVRKSQQHFLNQQQAHQ